VSRSGRLLALNAGSSSLKLGLFDAAGETQLAEKETDWDLAREGAAEAALTALLSDLDTAELIAIGHRVVHGGSRFTDSVLLTPAVRGEIEALASLAPLHNRPALAVIDAVSRAFPGVPQVAAFDTAFHATLPPQAYLYALPFEWYERCGVRRFGFHGLSHAYCAMRTAELLGRPLAELRVVTCHLGSGCSLAAIANGQSVATTMGFTPLDGIMMATRPGSVDPGILTFILGKTTMDASEMESILYHESGLKGISGLSGDMREILAARAAGHARASLALDLYVTRLREGIAAMATALGGLDALAFAGGVGEHASEVRAAACAGFGWIGLDLDEAANVAAVADVDVATADALARIMVLHTREELMVARETAHVLRSESPAAASDA
jgi:acetate kinase